MKFIDKAILDDIKARLSIPKYLGLEAGYTGTVQCPHPDHHDRMSVVSVFDGRVCTLIDGSGMFMFWSGARALEWAGVFPDGCFP